LATDNESPTLEVPKQFDDYIGRKERYSRDFGDTLMRKCERWYQSTLHNGMARQWKQNYRLYMNAAPEGDMWRDDTFAITGDNGELLQVRMNEFRSLITHMVNLATQSAISLTANAVNSDAQSILAAQLWDDVLGYYTETWKNGRINKMRRKAVEFAMFLSNGYTFVEWDTSAGSPYAVDEQGQRHNQGDFYIKTCSVYDVYFDTNLEDDEEMNWCVWRDFYNRYDVASRVMKMQGMDPNEQQKIVDAIMAAESKTELDRAYRWNWDNETDQVPIYKFYHRSTPTCPQGRYAWVLHDGTVIIDGDNPYTDEFGQAIIPVLIVRAADGMGSLFGYSPGNDIAPAQQAYNLMFSTIMTNFAGYGVQNIVVDRGSDLDVTALSGGMNLLEKNPNTAEPKGLNLTALPGGWQEAMQMIQGEGEKLSGINATVRGDPESNLKAAKSLEIMASVAVQYMSSLQFSVTMYDQGLGNLLLRIGQNFAKTDRIVAITGKDKVARSKTWNGDILSRVAMVVAEQADPALRTLPMKMKMADKLLEQKVITSAAGYITMLTSGKADDLYTQAEAQENLIRQEDEQLLNGKQPVVLATDNHQAHISGHLIWVDSLEVRTNSQQLKVHLDHIHWHQRMMQNPPDPRTPEQFDHDQAMQQAQAQQQQQMQAAHGAINGKIAAAKRLAMGPQPGPNAAPPVLPPNGPQPQPSPISGMPAQFPAPPPAMGPGQPPIMPQS
jgi:hypothetical protein